MKTKLLVILLLFCIAACPAGFTPVYDAVCYMHETRADPPEQIHVVRIDLHAPNVSCKVARGGDDPDGDGPWQTTLLEPTKIADREGFDVVINGDFFRIAVGKDAEGAAARQEYKSGVIAAAVGPAVTDGKLWAPTTRPRPSVVIDAKNHATIATIEDPPPDADEVISGSDTLVADGKNVAPPDARSSFTKGPHPRSAIGIANDGATLLLVVVDGRSKDSLGMSLTQLADVMLKYGARDAINLDGGGSTMLGIRDPQSHKMGIKNHPSDGKERPVANVLGVKLKAGPATQPD